MDDTAKQRHEASELGGINTKELHHADHVLDAEASIDPEEERALVRKIDMVVLPLMCFIFFLQYLDKQSLSYAAVGSWSNLNLRGLC